METNLIKSNMKSHLFYGLMTALIISTTSCKKDEDVPTTQVPEKKEQIKELKLESSTVQLSINGKASIKITDGNGGYTAKSSDEKTVKASVNNDVISIEAIKEGSTTVIVSDAKSKTATITVNVWKSITLDKKEVTLKKGERSTVTIQAGEGQYTATSQDANIASATISNSIITIEAIKKGETTITVTDSKSSQTETIKVIVVGTPLTLSKESVTLKKEASEYVNITSGNNNYSVNSNNNGIATATLEGNKVKITAVEAGETTITVTDNGESPAQTKTIAVTVNGNESKIIDNNFVIDAEGTLTEVKNITPELVIPAGIKKIGGALFRGNKVIKKITMESIVEIEGAAFLNTSIEEVIIGDKIKNIGATSFGYCRKLTKFVIKASTPPTTDPSSFFFSNGSKNLIVPAGTKDKYSNTGIWKANFKNIQEIQ